ncbi:hypothetical protein C3L23_07275 [Nautilia sp. PV-1]|uniref:hypothetical protein n=1 Tax=Nautilia sp. PV-1 TaxID=2579250 RepID=UPI000FDAC5BC|nr:hypothetical protein [Nautilia sp. PV-1]AZV47080.1 hypothetical protein C3L23_07275 [Nautilia sp. PV-1]
MKKILLFISFSLLFAEGNLCSLLPDNIGNYSSYEKCKSVNIQTDTVKGEQAYKEYKKNNKNISLQILKGGPSYQFISVFSMPLTVNTDETFISTTTCKKLKCAVTYAKKEHNGIIVVMLDKKIPAVLVFTFENMKPDEVVKILNKVDIQKIKNNL